VFSKAIVPPVPRIKSLRRPVRRAEVAAAEVAAARLPRHRKQVEHDQ